MPRTDFNLLIYTVYFKIPRSVSVSPKYIHQNGLYVTVDNNCDYSVR